MKISKEDKDTIATLSAVFMLVFGVVLTCAGFVVDPLGQIDDSVLWVLGQSLLYSGGIFGITLYTKRRFAEMENRMDEYMHVNHEHTEE